MAKLVAFLCLVRLLLHRPLGGPARCRHDLRRAAGDVRASCSPRIALAQSVLRHLPQRRVLTLAAVALFAALYAWLKPIAPACAIIGLVFVPIYGVLNLVAYLSQVALVPALVALRADVEYVATADVLLRLTLQAWPASAMAFFNGLAYAILGIPSILFGFLLWRQGGACVGAARRLLSMASPAFSV